MNRAEGSKWLRPLVALKSLRRRLVFHLRQEHFDEFGLALPIGSGLVCPILQEENLLSFGEIFGEREYERLFAEIAVPRRWIDIGAHCGYFSLHVASRLLRQEGDGWAALLVEPDPRRRAVLDAGLRQPALRGRLRWMAAGVGAAGAPRSFVLRPGMVSSWQGTGPGGGDGIAVPVASEAEIAGSLAGPYDLLKLDVEGAEYEFVQHYGGLCRASRAVVVEWHAPSDDAPCIAGLRATLASYGLTRVLPLRPLHRSMVPGPLAVTGLELFQR